MNEYAERHQIFRLDQLSVKKKCVMNQRCLHTFLYFDFY